VRAIREGIRGRIFQIGKVNKSEIIRDSSEQEIDGSAPEEMLNAAWEPRRWGRLWQSRGEAALLAGRDSLYSGPSRAEGSYVRWFWKDTLTVQVHSHSGIRKI
jgi:hypothetical protein